MWDEARETAGHVVALASHGIPMTMAAWRDMTMRDREALIEVVNAAEQRARSSARKGR